MFKLNKVLPVLSVILIGAIGSGVWDLFLKDFIYWLGGILVTITSSFYQGYFDRLYKFVGSQYDQLLYLPSIAIITLIILTPVFFYSFLTILLNKITSFPKDISANIKPLFNKLENYIVNTATNRTLFFKIVLIIPLILSSFLYADLLLVSTTNRTAIRIVQQRLDIIRPYMSENKYYQLVSDFRMVENRERMQKLITNIDQIALEQKIKLPKIKLYGINSTNEGT